MMRNSEEAAGKPKRGQRIIFTGPDGIGDYKPKSNYFPQYIGVGVSSPGATGDLGYLFRAAPHSPHPLPKNSYVGAVGWGWQHNRLLNSGILLSNMQIKKTYPASAGGWSDSEVSQLTDPAPRAEHETSARWTRMRSSS